MKNIIPSSKLVFIIYRYKDIILYLAYLDSSKVT